MSDVVIFAPSPILTVTIEDNPDGAEVHFHAGGQGVWQARMLRRLGVNVTMCSVLSGESGRMLHHLLEDEGTRVVAIEREGRGGAFVHDRRGGERIKIVETGGESINRHDLDELYGATLRESLDSSLVILSGPAGDNTLPADIYRRLAADLRAGGCRVLVDLSGDRLSAALAGGVSAVKVSHEELLADGRVSATGVDDLVRAMRAMHLEGAQTVIVTRADRPTLLLDSGVISEVTMPTMEVADTSGAGDSLTAGVAAALARGAGMLDAIRLGAAAGALNVTRHGRGTGDAETIERLRRLVTVKPIDESREPAERVSPGQLAARIGEERVDR